jgi:hypothetical protein
VNIPEKPEDMLEWTAAEIVKVAGFPYHRGTDYCKKYCEEHGNCEGCESNSGCSRVARIMALILQATLYKPKDFADQMKTDEAVSEKIAEILKT